MSDNIPLTVQLVTPERWNACINPEEPNSLIKHPYGRTSFNAYSRNGGLMVLLNGLFASAGYDRLQVLTFDPYKLARTQIHKYEYIKAPDPEDTFGDKEKYAYTLVDRDFDELIADFDALFDWCRQNTKEVIDNLETGKESEVADTINKAMFTLEPNDDANRRQDDHCDLLFIFSVLKTIRELLFEAKKQGYYLVCEVWQGFVFDDMDV